MTPKPGKPDTIWSWSPYWENHAHIRAWISQNADQLGAAHARPPAM